MNTSDSRSIAHLCSMSLAALLCGACSSLLPASEPQPTFYSLAGNSTATAAASLVAPAMGAPTLLINPTRAAAGYDSRRIIYVRDAYKLEDFAHSEWVETPARMLAPLLAQALEQRGVFSAVVQAPSAVSGDLRLDTEIVRLQQDFTSRPSRARFTLRAFLVDSATRRVIAWREFDEALATTSEDPQGGVAAANGAVQAVLGQLAVFCTDAVMKWQAVKPVARHTG